MKARGTATGSHSRLLSRRDRVSRRRLITLGRYCPQLAAMQPGGATFSYRLKDGECRHFPCIEAKHLTQ